MKLAALLAVATTAYASRAEAYVGRVERPMVTASSRQPRLARTVERAPPIAALAAVAPLAIAGWRALWDRETGVALRLWGGSIAVPGANADPAIAERAARAFLVAHLDVLAPGAIAADFDVIGNQVDRTAPPFGGAAGRGQAASVDRALRTVGFRQLARGVPVVGGQLSVVFAHDRLFVVGSEALPNVAAALPASAMASTDAASQRARAEAWIASVTATPAHAPAIAGRVILPIVHTRARAGAAPDIEYIAVDQLDVESVGAVGRWDVFVDVNGTPIARRDRLRYDNSGTITFNAALRYPLSTRIDYPAGDDNISVAGAAQDTALDGTFTWTGADPVSVIPSLLGTLIEITNQAGTLATTTLSIASGGTGEWSLAADEFGDAQLAAYAHAMVAKAHTHVINPGIDAWTNAPLAVYVNEFGSCNGYSTGQDIHFYQGDATCENTGRLADVVFHEYGHSQHFNSIIPGAGMFNTPLSEGLADFNACDINNDSGMGRGFYFTDAPLREIDPIGLERVYPADLSEDPHVSGEIISGALWDLRKGAIAQMGMADGVAFADEIFLGVMQRAADIPSSYIAALTIDDDDGNLANGTPHQCLIDNAFGPHGLAEADFVTTDVGPPIVDGLNITVPVTTPSKPDCPPPNVTGMSIDWWVGDGSDNTVTLTPADSSADPTATAWSGAIPAQPDNTLVTYTVTATLDNGSSVIYPNNPADPRYQLFVGAVTPIWCQDFATDPQWTQSGTIGGEWQWDAPGMPSAAASGDPTTAYSGSDVYGTVILGNGEYLPSDDTYTETPAIDVSAYAEVRLQYRRWLTVEDALYDQASISANGTTVWTNAASTSGTLNHVDKEWRFHDVDLTPQAASGSVTVRWELKSDDSLELGGWTLGNVCVVGLQKAAKCGDGVLDPGEQCDDGNTIAGDGCSADCTIETAVAGGGGCDAGSSDGRGGDRNGGLPFALGFTAVALVVLRRRR